MRSWDAQSVHDRAVAAQRAADLAAVVAAPRDRAQRRWLLLLRRRGACREQGRPSSQPVPACPRAM